jgi:hypothetical protein
MKINLNAVVTAPKVIDHVLAKGLSMERGDNGEVVLKVHFPGVRPVAMTRSDMAAIGRTLARTVPMGEGVADTFARTASINRDGGLVARFEEKERARSVEFTAEDREDILGLFSQLNSDWDSFASQVEEDSKSE